MVSDPQSAGVLRARFGIFVQKSFFAQSLRPKGMHRRTYERLTAELHDEMEQHDLLFMTAAAPLMARLMKADARRRCNR